MDPEQPLSRFPFLRAAIDGLMAVGPIGAVILPGLGIMHALRDATAPLAVQLVHGRMAARRKDGPRLSRAAASSSHEGRAVHDARCPVAA